MTDLRDQVDTGFTDICGKLDAAAGQQQIVELLTSLIGDRPEGTTPSIEQLASGGFCASGEHDGEQMGSKHTC